MNYLHVDFSKSAKNVEIQDLLSGQVYLTDRNILEDQSFINELENRRKGICVDVASIEHWLTRGWDASLPLYMSSRHVKFVDSGKDRNEVLEKLFESYSTVQACPLVTVRHKESAQPIQLDRVCPDSVEWNKNYR